jgi:hypothetical protein
MCVTAPLLLVFTAAGLAGCAATDEHTAYPAAQTRAVAGRVGNHFDADIDTLAKVLGWTLGDMHWGQQSVLNDVTALSALAVTDNDEVVDIRAQMAKGGGIDVQIKVGHFGDPKREQEFLTTLDGRIKKWQKAHPQKGNSDRGARN